MDNIYLPCPHCKQMIQIEEINCAIFRCGIYKKNYQQIPPHLPKYFCEDLIKRDLIYGCSKPFKFITDNNEHKLIECEYI